MSLESRWSPRQRFRSLLSILWTSKPAEYGLPNESHDLAVHGRPRTGASRRLIPGSYFQSDTAKANSANSGLVRLTWSLYPERILDLSRHQGHSDFFCHTQRPMATSSQVSRHKALLALCCRQSGFLHIFFSDNLFW